MNVNDHAFGDINTHGGGEKPPCTGFIPDALPEAQRPVLAESSQTGVSTKNGLYGTIFKTTYKQLLAPNRYVLSITCGRENGAYDYFISKKVDVFYHT